MKQAYKKTLVTPLGDMLAIGDANYLYALNFLDTKGFEKQIKSFENQADCICKEGISDPIHSIEQELNAYFSGELSVFKTPVQLLGTEFQQNVWRMLETIPYGQTISYTELAEKAGKPAACRAAANANAVNRLAILIPCHRVIRLGGALGGYAGGIVRKQWLIEHEQSFIA